MKPTNYFVREFAKEVANEAEEAMEALCNARRQISELGTAFQLAPGEVRFIEPDTIIDEEDEQAATDMGAELSKISEQLKAIEARLLEIFEP